MPYWDSSLAQLAQNDIFKHDEADLPQGLKATFFPALDGMAKAMPFQRTIYEACSAVYEACSAYPPDELYLST